MGNVFSTAAALNSAASTATHSVIEVAYLLANTFDWPSGAIVSRFGLPTTPGEGELLLGRDLDHVMHRNGTITPSGVYGYYLRVSLSGQMTNWKNGGLAIAGRSLVVGVSYDGPSAECSKNCYQDIVMQSVDLDSGITNSYVIIGNSTAAESVSGVDRLTDTLVLITAKLQLHENIDYHRPVFILLEATTLHVVYAGHFNTTDGSDIWLTVDRISPLDTSDKSFLVTGSSLERSIDDRDKAFFTEMRLSEAEDSLSLSEHGSSSCPFALDDVTELVTSIVHFTHDRIANNDSMILDISSSSSVEDKMCAPDELCAREFLSPATTDLSLNNSVPVASLLQCANRASLSWPPSPSPTPMPTRQPTPEPPATVATEGVGGTDGTAVSSTASSSSSLSSESSTTLLDSGPSDDVNATESITSQSMSPSTSSTADAALENAASMNLIAHCLFLSIIFISVIN